MESFVSIRAVAAVIMRKNIDTDQILPGRFLVPSGNTTLGDGLFADWAWHADGSRNADFILNRPPYDGAKILIADRNFGCGSSREHAPIALRERGFRAVIAPSFGGIFFSNCFRNGLLPVVLTGEQVQALSDEVEAHGGARPVSVDLEREIVIAPSGIVHAFHAPRQFREMLLKGIDEIGLTLSRGDAIEAYRVRDRTRRPWVYAHGLAEG